MIDDPDIPDYDDDNDYAEGDVPLAEMDPVELAKLENLIVTAQSLPEEERQWVHLGMLHEMYGDDLEVL